MHPVSTSTKILSLARTLKVLVEPKLRPATVSPYPPLGQLTIIIGMIRQTLAAIIVLIDQNPIELEAQIATNLIHEFGQPVRKRTRRGFLLGIVVSRRSVREEAYAPVLSTFPSPNNYWRPFFQRRESTSPKRKTSVATIQ
jgi:hypothetical protein